MKRLGLLFGLLALIAPLDRAAAAAAMLCAPETSVGTLARPVTNPNTGNTYALNGAGCAVIQAPDIGYFITQGFSQGASGGNLAILTPATLTGTTAVLIGTLPANAYIQHIFLQNQNANAVSGGVNVGSTSGGSDIVAAAAVTGTTAIVDATLVAKNFIGPQAIYAAAATSWANSNVGITVVYGLF
jgi:hypothetical protein